MPLFKNTSPSHHKIMSLIKISSHSYIIMLNWPNGKAQRAGKRGAGFAPFAKLATLLTVRLERFVRAFSALRLRFIFYPGLAARTIEQKHYSLISSVPATSTFN